ncbi:hypothetical protein EJ05DRAFT_536155 [Pseudovirgaria hyperparasitica]|uniref:VPS9 domain-containing protein n=1 Tax=Pseudovirgaria hyperparasitica TaxID=470096 RepID=A0A6A6WJ98_9PEZI|nr:uncharacterized protein EJ05DRAFT_536155 [Pseudovirgaria hyperparasitica]KAF2761371.1 hypothetical protein EJ05DRAFT_536155 [Pseudovirgaria hyperparasitica]
MQRSTSDDASRSRPLQTSKSFSRLETTSDSPLTRSRASTVGADPIPEILAHEIAPSTESEDEAAKVDFFTTKEDDEPTNDGDEAEDAVVEGPPTLEQLPIEIRSMLERFLESLTAKVHPTPLSVDTLSDMFQEFYTRASSQIGTHIAALASRIGRETRSSSGDVIVGSHPKMTRTSSSGSEMLTPSEVTDRRKARRQLELKRVALEEAVERVVCSKLYEKLWRHRSTDDGERDQKLRSRIAALALVGIGLKELLVSSEDVTTELRETTAQNEEIIKEWLAGARNGLARMDEEQYPLGKLQQLTAVHKSIVETLSRIFPASSSADEILPTLIYTLITSPPESVNVISNVNFIQRFRANTRMDGEAAYCLVNLEAAISFLETVDLSSLRAGELPSGPDKASSHTTPRSESGPMNLGLSQEPEAPTSHTEIASKGQVTPTPRAQRRLSNLITSQTTKIEAASDAVRESIKSSADQALDTINNTLEESMKFFFGRLREQQKNNSAIGPDENIIPKTLEDARKLVSTPPPEEDAASTNEDGKPDEPLSRLDSKLSDIFGGKRPLRERSVDSTKSGGSGKRVAFASEKNSTANTASIIQTATGTTPVATGNAAVESMRTLGTSLNPLNRFANINMIPRFGRGPATSTPSGVTATATATGIGKDLATKSETVSIPDDKAVKALTALEELKKTSPPLKKYMEMKDAKTVRIGEVDELLKEYQRLAAALRQALQSGL